jgi:hypothetical protein
VTATHVDGVEVIADEPCRSGLTGRGGKPIYFKQTRELLLADGRTVYGCVHCDFVRGKPSAIRPHLVKHGTRAAAGLSDDLTLAQLLRKLEAMEKVTAERDQWKARALKAEKALGILRRTLREDG